MSAFVNAILLSSGDIFVPILVRRLETKSWQKLCFPQFAIFEHIGVYDWWVAR